MMPLAELPIDEEKSLQFAITADDVNNRVIIAFGKKVDWLDMSVEQAEILANLIKMVAEKARPRTEIENLFIM